MSVEVVTGGYYRSTEPLFGWLFRVREVRGAEVVTEASCDETYLIPLDRCRRFFEPATEAEFRAASVETAAWYAAWRADRS